MDMPWGFWDEFLGGLGGGVSSRLTLRSAGDSSFNIMHPDTASAKAADITDVAVNDVPARLHFADRP
jgi:hypothetical protein